VLPGAGCFCSPTTTTLKDSTTHCFVVSVRSLSSVLDLAESSSDSTLERSPESSDSEDHVDHTSSIWIQDSSPASSPEMLCMDGQALYTTDDEEMHEQLPSPAKTYAKTLAKRRRSSVDLTKEE